MLPYATFDHRTFVHTHTHACIIVPQNVAFHCQVLCCIMSQCMGAHTDALHCIALYYIALYCIAMLHTFCILLLCFTSLDFLFAQPFAAPLLSQVGASATQRSRGCSWQPVRLVPPWPNLAQTVARSSEPVRSFRELQNAVRVLRVPRRSRKNAEGRPWTTVNHFINHRKPR